MFETIAIVVGVFLVAVVVLLVVAANKPGTFGVQRATTIKAPPQKIFDLINDFHAWPAWSPWEKLDPAMNRTHSGAASGVGAVYEWEGNKKVGKGRMEITESASPSKVVIKLDFLRPFEAHNVAEFALEPHGDGTTLTWAMHGPQPYMMKVMTTVFLNMDKLIGKDFEKGLAALKSIAEA